MATIKEFRFYWADAWDSIAGGIDTILEISDSGTIMLRALVGGKTYTVALKDFEAEIVYDLKSIGVEEWNHKYYEMLCEDGSHWMLSYTYDDCHIIAAGRNGFPKQFTKFLDFMHDKLGLPQIGIEDYRFIKSASKETKIYRLDDEMWSAYSRPFMFEKYTTETK